MSEEIHKQASRAVAWVGLASGIIAAVDAVALVILLRFWVTTKQLGIATEATTLFFFLDLVTEQGLGAVLIQREKLDEPAASTLFWLNAGIAAIAFFAVLGLGPLIGSIQNHAVIGSMLIVYATKLFYQNVYFVPMAIMRRELRFKELSTIRTLANFGDVAGRIGFAAAGEPIWCFVAGPLIRVLITGIGVQICQPWKPRWVFDRAVVRASVAFASKTMGTWYLQHFYTNGIYNIIGYYFGETAVGVFRVAYELVLYPVNWVSNVVQQVAFPAFARLRTNADALSAQFIQFSRQNLTTVLPIVVVIVVGAPDILELAFPKAKGAETITRLLCLVGMLRAFDSLYVPLLDGLGWAGRNLLVSAVAFIVLPGLDILMSVTLGERMGPTAVALGRMIGYPLVIVLHGYLVLSILQLPVRRYIRQLGGLVLCAMVAIVPGLALWYVFPSMAPGPRLGLEAGSSLLVMGLLLAKFEGVTPKSILAGIRK